MGCGGSGAHSEQCEHGHTVEVCAKKFHARREAQAGCPASEHL